MELLNSLADWQKVGVGGLVMIPFLLYQIYRLFKENNKGDKIDARIDAYSQNLQTTIDKLIKKLEDLQVLRDRLVAENATFSAQLVIMKAELTQLQESKERLVKRVIYLEGVLKEKGIEYVA